MSNGYSKYYTTYYDINGEPVDVETAHEEAAKEFYSEFYSDEIEELENDLGKLQEELEELESIKEELDEDSDKLKDIETQIADVEENIEAVEAEIRDYLTSDDPDITHPGCLEILHVGIYRLLDDVYDKFTNTLKFDKLLDILTHEYEDPWWSARWASRHRNMLEAVLDTSFFENHKDFFENLYIENLITDKDLLRIFESCKKFGEYLFVRDHKYLVQIILKEAARCLPKDEATLKTSFNKLCDKLLHYATHELYAKFRGIDVDHGLIRRPLSEKEIDHNFIKRLERFKVLGVLETLDFDKNQKLELFNVLKNNEVALNRVKCLLDNNIISNYDFESLMQYLKKVEKTNILNI